MIFDENSTDNTINLIKNSTIEHEIINIETEGLFFAYNKALQILKKRKFEDIIFFLHSDDLIYDSETLQIVKNQFDNHNISSLIGNIVYFNNDENKFFRTWKSNFPTKQKKVTLKCQICLILNQTDSIGRPRKK